MAIGNIKRWHWMVISLVLGLAMATVRLAFDDGMLQGFGESINDQRRFEEAVSAVTRAYPSSRICACIRSRSTRAAERSG